MRDSDRSGRGCSVLGPITNAGEVSLGCSVKSLGDHSIGLICKYLMCDRSRGNLSLENEQKFKELLGVMFQRAGKLCLSVGVFRKLSRKLSAG